VEFALSKEENEQTGINRSESNPAMRRVVFSIVQRRSPLVAGDLETATNFTRVCYSEAKHSTAKLFTDLFVDDDAAASSAARILSQLPILRLDA